MTDFADAASEMSYQSSTIAMPTARAGQTHSQTQHATSVPSRQGSPAVRSSPVRQASPTIPQVSPTLSAFKSPEQEALFIDDDDFAPAGNVSGAAKPTPEANANIKAGATTTSLTGDPELDDFLNM